MVKASSYKTTYNHVANYRNEDWNIYIFCYFFNASYL